MLNEQTRKRVEDEIAFAEAHHLETMPIFDAEVAKELIEALDTCETEKSDVPWWRTLSGEDDPPVHK